MFDVNDRLQLFAHSLEGIYVQTQGDQEGFLVRGADGMGTLFLTVTEGAEVYGFQCKAG